MTSRTYEFRPLGIIELIDQGFHIYRSHFLTLFMIALVPYVLFGAMQGYGTAMVGPVDPKAVDPNQALMSIVVSLVGALVMAVGQWMAAAASTQAVSGAVLQRPIAFGGAYAAVGNRIGPFIVLLIQLVLVYTAGLLACCIGIIPASILTSLAIAALMIERLAPSDAILRSYTMVKADFWRAAGLLILMGLISLVVVGGVTTAIEVAKGFVPATNNPTNPMYIGLTVGAQALTSVVAAFVAPLATAVTTLYYFDLRVRNEAFDLYRLEDALYGYSESREAAGGA